MCSPDGTDGRTLDPQGNQGAVRAADDSSGSLEGSSADDPTRASDPLRAPPSAPAMGTPAIDGYLVHERIHHGGQGIVFRATQLGTKRVVALKVLLEGEYAGDTARHRFEREVELAASLRHPNIVTILDSGVSSGRCYFAMEYIDGLRLHDFFRKNRPNLKQSIELLEGVCTAVNFAHQRGVIHRDLKPSNILVDADGQPHVLDFGLAKSRREHDPRETTVEALSMPGQVLGTLAYMSPEQAAGASDVDVRSDVYSLGVVAYEALLGRAPYPVDGPLGEVLNRIAKDEPQRPRSVRSSSRFGKLVNDELETILLKTLEKDASRRYQTAGELGRDLRRYLDGEPIEAKRASGMYMFKKTLRRYRLQAGFAAVVLAMLVTFLIVFAVQYRQERSLRAHAEELQELADKRADEATIAEQHEREARRQAERDKRLAQQAAEQRRRALVRQSIQAGDLAMIRGDLSEARDSYWRALHDSPDNAAGQWALRQYYAGSGELGVDQLYPRTETPIAISPGGALAAVCESSDALALYSLESGDCLAWSATPGEVLAASVDEAGRVAAAGATWLRMWSPESATPAAVVDFVRAANPLAIYTVLGGDALALIDGQAVRTYDSESGRLISERQLAGVPTAPPQFSAAADTLAIPTTVGIELVGIANDGRLEVRLIWSAKDDGQAHAVRFIGDRGLAVLGDAVFVRLLDDREFDAWTFLLKPVRDWNMLDFTDDGRVAAFGSPDGRLAVYREGRLDKQWRISLGGLEQIRLTPDGETLVTLDNRGSVTRWSTRFTATGRRLVADAPALKWAHSRNDEIFLLADSGGRINYCRPESDPELSPVELPGLVRVLSGVDVSKMSLALSASGKRGVVAYDDQLWLARFGQRRLRPLRWRRSEDLKLDGNVAISDSGRLIAASANRLSTGDSAVVILPTGAMRRTSRSKPAIAPFPGSVIQNITFAPGGAALIVSRANGELILLDTEKFAGHGGKPSAAVAESAQLWTVLDAPAYALAFDRNGKRLAAACDDGLVRLLSPTDAMELLRINVGRRIASLGFNATGNILMTRRADGVLSLYDADSGERLRQRAVAAPEGAALAAWVGNDDALLLSVENGVEFRDPGVARKIVEQNASYAARRQVVQSLANYEYDQAWAEAGRLRESDKTAGGDAQAVILDRVLRRRRVSAPDDWIHTVAADADSYTLLRLGHAAYAGGRFELAFSLLGDAARMIDGELDAYTAWRLAECEYLLGDPNRAAEQLARLIERRDFGLRDIPHAYLELLTALALADRADEAVNLLRSAPTHERIRPLKNTTAMAATQLNALTMLHKARTDAPLPAVLGAVKGRVTPFRNDAEFVEGEIALKHGDAEQARNHYQACLDIDRDEWPADWARFRLAQLKDTAKPSEMD